jgi:protein subunit release factor B
VAVLVFAFHSLITTTNTTTTTHSATLFQHDKTPQALNYLKIQKAAVGILTKQQTRRNAATSHSRHQKRLAALGQKVTSSRQQPPFSATTQETTLGIFTKSDARNNNTTPLTTPHRLENNSHGKN